MSTNFTGKRHAPAGSRAHGAVAALAAALALCLSCRTTGGNGDPGPVHELKSEVRVLRNRAVAVERRNAVLEDENLSYRKEVRERGARIETLEAEARARADRYARDLELANGRIDNLEKKNAILEKESSEKIRELTGLNRTMEKTLGDRIAELARLLKEQESAAAARLEIVQKENAAREFELSGVIDVQKREAARRQEALEALGRERDRLATEKASLEKTVAGQAAAREALASELARARDEATVLSGEREKALKRVAELEADLAAARAERDELLRRGNDGGTAENGK